MGFCEGEGLGSDPSSDRAGRYYLNDLHKASGGAAGDRPALFMRRTETDRLVPAGRGKDQGAYIAKELRKQCVRPHGAALRAHTEIPPPCEAPLP